MAECDKTGSVYRQWIFSIVGNLPILTYGLQSGWISPTIQVLQSELSPSGYPLQIMEITWIASALSMSAIFSCTTYSYIADNFGRKIAIFSIVIPQALGFVIKLISAHPLSLLVSQIVSGLAAGGVFAVSPLYGKEISQDSLRGTLTSIGMLFQSLGVLIMYAMGAYMDFHVVLYIALSLPIINILALIKAPESPPYLVKKGRVEEATSIMAYLRGVDTNNKVVQSDISTIRSEVEQAESLPKVSCKTMLTNKVSRRALCLAYLLLTVLDMGGNFAVFTYASVIFEQSGVTVQPELQTLLLPAVTLMGSLLASVVIERCGRKPTLLTSLVFTGVPMAVLAAAQLMMEHGVRVPFWLAVVCIVVSVFAFGVLLPIPFIVVSEIFSIEHRAKVLGYLVTYGWFICFLQAMVFTTVSEYLGMYTMFFIFSSFNLIGAVICSFCMPETKGKTLEEIENILAGCK